MAGLARYRCHKCCQAAQPERDDHVEQFRLHDDALLRWRARFSSDTSLSGSAVSPTCLLDHHCRSHAGQISGIFATELEAHARAPRQIRHLFVLSTFSLLDLTYRLFRPGSVLYRRRRLASEDDRLSCYFDLRVSLDSSIILYIHELKHEQRQTQANHDHLRRINRRLGQRSTDTRHCTRHSRC